MNFYFFFFLFSQFVDLLSFNDCSVIIEPGEVDGQDVAVVQLLEDDQGLAAG